MRRVEVCGISCDLGAAIMAFEPERCRATRGMKRAMVLGLDDHCPPLAAAIAAPRLAPAIPPPTMMTSKLRISPAGYELESRAV